MVYEKLAQQGVGYRAWPQGFDSKRTTILMVHGAGGCAEIWNAQVRPLGRLFNALALDLPGHGNTTHDGYGKIFDYAEWLSQAIETFLSVPVVLMGHSMGGAICQALALKRPELVKALILVSTGPRLKVAPAFLEGLKKQFDKTVELIIKYAYSTGSPPALLAQGADLMKRSGPNVLYNDFAACDRFDVRHSIHEINIPTLIVCGEDDKLTPPSLSRKLHEKIKNSRLSILPKAGHMVMIEAWNTLNDLAIEFVQSL